MESCVINRIRRHLFSLAIFSHVNRIRRHLLLLAIFSNGNRVLEDIYCCWLYFPWKAVINHVRRHNIGYIFHGNSCNKSY